MSEFLAANASASIASALMVWPHVRVVRDDIDQSSWWLRPCESLDALDKLWWLIESTKPRKLKKLAKLHPQVKISQAHGREREFQIQGSVRWLCRVPKRWWWSYTKVKKSKMIPGDQLITSLNKQINDEENRKKNLSQNRWDYSLKKGHKFLSCYFSSKHKTQVCWIPLLQNLHHFLL